MDEKDQKEIKVLDHGYVKLLDKLGSDATICMAARVSYQQGTKSVSDDRTLLRYLVRMGHSTPLEMVEFVFQMKLPIFVARQLVRHRTANLSEISARYSILPEEFYVPEKGQVCEQSKNNKQGRGETLDDLQVTMFRGDTKELGTQAFETYKQHLDDGVARELARINLPLSTYTNWIWKMDLNNLGKFLKLRLDSHAQWEIRQYAQAIRDLITPHVPLTMEAFEDYLFESHTFSKQELAALRLALIQGFTYNDYGNLRDALVRQGCTKREIDEFLGALASFEKEEKDPA